MCIEHVPEIRGLEMGCTDDGADGRPPGVDAFEPTCLANDVDVLLPLPARLDVDNPLKPILVAPPVGAQISWQIGVQHVFAAPDEIDERLRHGEPDDEVEQARVPAEKLDRHAGFSRSGARIPLVDVRIENDRCEAHGPDSRRNFGVLARE